jgi:hypothetical protein
MGRLLNSLNAVANKQNYLARLQVAIEHLHDCGAIHRKTVPVEEVVRGKSVWKGEAEVFDLHGHDKAKRCYGWLHPEGEDDKGERFVTVLGIPPVDSAETAVKMSMYSDIKKARN